MTGLIKFFTALALTIAGSFSLSAAAFAHTDELVTYPEADSVVDGGYIPIELTFAEPLMLMEDGSGHEVAVTDPDGEPVSLQCSVKADGSALTTQIAANTDGEYNVAWRSVSEDGHPVSGSFKFIVRAVPDFELPANTNLMCPQDEPTAVDDPSVISQGNIAEDADGSTGFIQVIAVAVPLVAVLAVAVVLIRRKKKD